MPAKNLLFLYTDEQRFDTLAAYGNPHIHMPNLNRLASRSTVFERAYVTQPVCTPSRSSLLTGQYPHTNGCTANNIPLRPQTRCFPELLDDPAYQCAHIGKWHLGDEIYPQHGFPTWIASEDTYHAHYSPPHREFDDRSDYHHWLVGKGVTPTPPAAASAPSHPALVNRFFRGQIHALPEPLSRPAFLAEMTCRTLQEFGSDPFVCFVNFLEPHMPFHSCRDGQYDPEDVILPPNFLHQLNRDTPQRARASAQSLHENGYDGDVLQTEREWRELIARYWGMCSLVDTHIGRILDCLEESGQAEDTLIVFTSDHGDMMGSHGLLAKTYLFEESVRVPMTVHVPGQTDSRLIRNPVSQVDLVPTLLDLMGRPTPADCEGESLAACVLHGTEPEGDVFLEWTDPGDAMRAAGLAQTPASKRGTGEHVRTVVTTDGWKFNWSTTGVHELYNLTDDPCECENRIADPGCRPRIDDAMQRIRSWQERTGDVRPLPAIP